MSSPLVKPALFTAAVGTSGAGGYFGSKLITSKSPEKTPETRKKFSIASLIAQDSAKELLTKDKKQGSDADWQAAWTNYKNQNSSHSTENSDPWKIKNWINEKNQANAPQDFMDRCDTESKKEVFDTSDPAYKNVYSWCTKAKATSKPSG
ncbi:hypothetical protein MHF_1280 [Mycoplasma haemofelis Ohio2]|uniref:Uncharacterized protein n=1 Tax=Mycoplasma haemofelis (strain Ohio2) TaxID=859194 RepID=F6FFU8_MYCHI|nr:hypothetical protein MHF_1280 [Mycoplasma haemofelis Ohio2]